MIPPPAKCEDAARRQATSVAVRNSAFPSTMYLENGYEQSFTVEGSNRLQDGHRISMSSVDVRPM
jgi:hypothetical protein